MKSHIAWLPNDKIALSDRCADALLRQALAGIKTPAVGSVRSFPARGALEERPAVVHVIPLTGSARDLFGGGLGILAVTTVNAPAAVAVALIQGLLDLSPSQARVARGITEGLRLDQTATRLGLTTETIRTRTKRIFAKTGINRQSQLAALLGAVPKFSMG